jgi:hypothetical protein
VLTDLKFRSASALAWSIRSRCKPPAAQISIRSKRNCSCGRSLLFPPDRPLRSRLILDRLEALLSVVVGDEHRAGRTPHRHVRVREESAFSSQKSCIAVTSPWFGRRIASVAMWRIASSSFCSFGTATIPKDITAANSKICFQDMNPPCDQTPTRGSSIVLLWWQLEIKLAFRKAERCASPTSSHFPQSALGFALFFLLA